MCLDLKIGVVSSNTWWQSYWNTLKGTIWTWRPAAFLWQISSHKINDVFSAAKFRAKDLLFLSSVVNAVVVVAFVVAVVVVIVVIVVALVVAVVVVALVIAVVVIVVVVITVFANPFQSFWKSKLNYEEQNCEGKKLVVNLFLFQLWHRQLQRQQHQQRRRQHQRLNPQQQQQQQQRGHARICRWAVTKIKVSSNVSSDSEF